MRNKFISVEEASGVFAEAMKPHKKWFEKMYMSPLIELNGSLYHVVCTLSRFRKSNLRKVLLCTDQGEVIQSKELMEEIVTIAVYLHYFQVFANNMAFDAQQSEENNFDRVIKSLQRLYTDLSPKLSANEKSKITEQLNYYHNTMQTIDDLAELSKQCLDIVESLEKLTINDVITEQFIEKMYQIIVKRGRLRGDVEAAILKNGLTTRGSIKKIMHASKYNKYISDKGDKNRVVAEAHNADRIRNSIIRKGETDWKFYEKWLNIDKGKFTIEKFISDLTNLNEAELFIQTNINIIAKEHWVSSPDLKY